MTRGELDVHRDHNSIFNINRVMGLCYFFHMFILDFVKTLRRTLLLHFSTDFNESLHMHALGCGGVHDTIFSLIGLTDAEI